MVGQGEERMIVKMSLMRIKRGTLVVSECDQICDVILPFERGFSVLIGFKDGFLQPTGNRKVK